MDPFPLFRRGWVLGAAAAILLVALVLVPGARPAPAAPAVLLDSLTVADGTASISASLGPGAEGARVTLNGHPLTVEASGHFAGIVALGDASSLDLAVATPATGDQTDFTIPVTSALGGIANLSTHVLDTVQQAGASLVQPAGGFQILDGQPLVVRGSIADSGGLASLSVNGMDALALLRSNQSFTLTVPGTTKAITLTTTDTYGVSETRSYKVLQRSTLVKTSQGWSIAAAGALGVRIAQVRYVAKGVLRTHRLRMVVTIKDRRGYLVRGAVVSFRAKHPKLLVRGVRTKTTSRAGKVSFVLPLRGAAFGKRLVLDTTARTPTAKASRRSSIALAPIRRRRR